MAKSKALDLEMVIYQPETGNGFTAAEAEEVLGWEEEPLGKDWSDHDDVEFSVPNINYKTVVEQTKTVKGQEVVEEVTDNRKKVRVKLTKCAKNREVRRSLWMRIRQLILTGQWVINGESIIRDDKGLIHNGQHRAIGVKMADLFLQQLPEKPEEGEDKRLSRKYYKDRYKVSYPIEVGMIMLSGISGKPEVIDTIDTGQGRSLGDVVYRRKNLFGKERTKKETGKLSKILAGACRLVWLRSSGKNISDAPHFSHSEAMAFQKNHPWLATAVETVFDLDTLVASGVDENGEGTGEEAGEVLETKRISAFISLANAAALLYLMGVSQTEPEKYFTGEEDHPVNNDELNIESWEKAVEFWSQFADGSNLDKTDPVLKCRSVLQGSSKSGASERDEAVNTIIKAWLLWKEGGEAKSVSSVKPQRKKDKETGKVKIVPECLGGIDTVGTDIGPTPAPKKAKKRKKDEGKSSEEGNGEGVEETGDGEETPKPKRKRRKKDTKKQFAASKAEPEGEWKAGDKAWIADADEMRVYEAEVTSKEYESVDDDGNPTREVRVKLLNDASDDEFGVDINDLELTKPQLEAAS